MLTLVFLVLLVVLLVTNTSLQSLALNSSQQCYIVLGDKPVSITYELDKEVANNITLSIDNLRVELAPNSYFLLMFGIPPNDLYGIAVLKDAKGSEEYYVIRGSQNEWFNVNNSFTGNVTLYIIKSNRSVEVKVYVNNSLIGLFTRNTTLLGVKSLALTLGNVEDINKFSGNVYLANIYLIVDGKQLIGFNNANNTYRFFVDKASITPSSDRLRLVCSYVTYSTTTITKTYTTTTVITGTTTYTVTSTTTTTTITTLPITKTSTVYEKVTKVLNETLTSTITSITTKLVVVEYIPWHIVIPSVLATIVAVVVLAFIVLRK